MLVRRTWLIGLLATGVLVLGALAFGLRQTLTGDGDEDFSPWLYCTTNPCQPLGLFPLPTPPALTHDGSLAAGCDYTAPGADDGVLLWHTDWDPLTEEGECVSRDEANELTQ